jgi:hypothetical protein
MAFSLGHVVPWGRSFAEYWRMFALTESDFQRRILGCADGPASFNAEATKLGASVVSVDPLYKFRAEEIRGRIKEACPQVLEQTRQNRNSFVWRDFATIESLGRARLRAMARFLADYAGSTEGRYVAAELPRLPFADNQFELALCSHFLFLYSDQLDAEFHVASVVELCRVAADVRVFPLVGLDNRSSPHLNDVVRAVAAPGRKVRIETVPYEFQRGGNQMLRIA